MSNLIREQLVSLMSYSNGAYRASNNSAFAEINDGLAKIVETIDDLEKLKMVRANDREEIANNPMKRKIEDICNDVRVVNCLIADGIVTVEDLLKSSPTDLLKIPNFGRKSLRNLTDDLRCHGIELTRGKRNG